MISTHPSYSDPAPSDISSGRDRFIAVDVTGPGILLAGVLPLNHVLSVSKIKDINSKFSYHCTRPRFQSFTYLEIAGEQILVVRCM